MTDAPLTTVEIEPKGAVRSSVIWMHGLGADARDFEPIVPTCEDEGSIKVVAEMLEILG